ncbi:MAG: SusC/RagA family TonB-linked outer membrane protein [Gemmatimonadota bacterium]
MRRFVRSIVAVGSLVCAPPLTAQQSVVSGTVLEAGSARPIAGAQVVATGTGRGTLTDATGRFLLSGLSGSEVRLEVVMIGYKTVRKVVAVGDTSVRFDLQQDVVALDAMVVTGTVGSGTKRAIGNSVSNIDAAAVTAKAPINDLQSLVNGRAPGVVILPGTGVVGSGARIRVRGISSLSLSQEPLIYVDGIRVNNAQATGPTVQAFGSAVISRWNDFDPEEIESIEIIKGPAAATLYGTEAANGVIQIITKKGGTGAPRYSFTIRRGANWFSNPEGRLWTNYGRNPLKANAIDSISYNELIEMNGPSFQTGQLQSYTANVSGGGSNFRYFLNGGYDRNEGIEPVNTDRKWNARANITVVPNDKVELSASTGYVHGKTFLPLESGGGGATWSTYFSRVDNLGTFRNGYQSGSPEAYYYTFKDWQNLDHFTASLRANYKPVSWLHNRLSIGTDVTTTEDAELVERVIDPAIQLFWGTGTNQGYKVAVRRTVYFNTLDFSSTAERNFRGTSTRTSVGFQYYRRYSGFVEGYGENFPARGLTAINAAAGTKTTNEDYAENVTVGTFVQEQLGWNDRLFLTGAVRIDNNSAFGADFDWVVYPKVSASWVISEEPFWKLAPVGTLKLRAAYGESGQQPVSFAALRTYAPIPGSGDSAAVSPSTLGNPKLGPERGKEIEVGFDAALLNDRVGVDFTYYHKVTSDAILDKDIAPSTGYSGRQFINAGEIKNQGVEALVRGTALSRRNISVDLTASIATNSNKVVSLGLPGTSFISLGGFTQHTEGFPVGSWFGRKLVEAKFDAANKLIASSIMCDDGKGGSVACATAPTVYLGRTMPKYEGAFSASVTLFERVRLYGLTDFKTGFQKLDGNARVRCVLFFRCRENFYPEEFLNDPLWLAQTQLGGTVYVDRLIDDASYLKLREVAASYIIPESWAGRIGARNASISIAGRNLHTWTKFKGLEPEASFLGGTRGGGSAQWEQNVTPQLAQFITTFNFGF